MMHTLILAAACLIGQTHKSEIELRPVRITQEKGGGGRLYSVAHYEIPASPGSPGEVEFSFTDGVPEYCDATIGGMPAAAYYNTRSKTYTVHDNYDGKVITIRAYYGNMAGIKVGPDNRLKGTAYHYDEANKLTRRFMDMVMSPRDAVGISAGNKPGDFEIRLAKGNPNNAKIRERIERQAKSLGVTVSAWHEEEGYDFLWKNEKGK